MTVRLTIHRSAGEIGGNCIEIACGTSRLLLDAGRPLLADPDTPANALLPESLRLDLPMAMVVLSHPHRDHYGLIDALPAAWPVTMGRAAERLIRLTADLMGEGTMRPVLTYQSGVPFTAGAFRITPLLTDHSAFDAHMLLIEVDGKRLLYTGDFRMHGRKAQLPKRLIAEPPGSLDVLLIEGTNVGRSGAIATETELEERFVELFRRTSGRVFVSWSAQNVDRTVTLFRACRRTSRTLVVDIYTAEVLHALADFGRLPAPAWDGLKVVITSRLKALYQRREKATFVEDVCVPNGMSAARLASERSKWVAMIRPSLISDFERRGVTPDPSDAWSFSQWQGYLNTPATAELVGWFDRAGTPPTHIHTSGHASRDHLIEFVSALAPIRVVPIHSFDWDEHIQSFGNVARLRDGETLTI